jgi:hypothetical protein
MEAPMSEDLRPTINFQLHEVVLDFSRLDNGRPRESVFVEAMFGRAILRPLGATGPEQRADLGMIRSLDPREIAPGTCGRDRRRPLNGAPL